MPLPQLTPVTALLGVVAAAWAGATIGLVAHTVGGPDAGPTAVQPTLAVSVPPRAAHAATGSVPDQVERAIAGGVTAGVERTTRLVTGGSPSAVPVAGLAAASPSADPVPPSAAPSSSPSPSPEPSPTDVAPTPSASSAEASPSPSPSAKHHRAR